MRRFRYRLTRTSNTAVSFWLTVRIGKRDVCCSRCKVPLGQGDCYLYRHDPLTRLCLGRCSTDTPHAVSASFHLMYAEIAAESGISLQKRRVLTALSDPPVGKHAVSDFLADVTFGSVQTILKELQNLAVADSRPDYGWFPTDTGRKLVDRRRFPTMSARNPYLRGDVR